MAFEGYIPVGLTQESFNKMTNGAGAAFENLALQGGESAADVSEMMEAALNSGNCLGATRGGFELDFSYETRSPEADGKYFEYKGSRQVTQTNASVGMSLLEASPKVLGYALPTSIWDEEKRMLKVTRSIQEDKYIDNLWIIAALKDGGYIGFNFKNALAVEGTNPTTSNDDEAEFPVTFVAHQSGLTDSQNAPYEIYWFPAEVDEDDE